MEATEIIVTLTDADLARAVRVAEARNKKARGVKSKKIVKENSEFETNFIGVCGEMAGARALGTDIDDRTFPDGGDNGTDAQAYGLTFQIKMTRKIPALIFNAIADFRADAALLVIQRSVSEFGVLGVISRERFARLAEKADYGYGERDVVPVRKLTPFGKIVEFAADVRKRKGIPDPPVAAEPEPTDPALAEFRRVSRQSVAEWVAEYEKAGESR